MEISKECQLSHSWFISALMEFCIRINFLKITPTEVLGTIDTHLAGKGVSLNNRVLTGLQGHSTPGT